MQDIYMDNAATSFPKAPGVGPAMARCIDTMGGSAGRGGYSAALEAGAAALELREQLSRLFGGYEPEYAVLTPGATFGLNMVLKGFLRPGDRVVTSSMEHNAVMRPLEELRRAGVAVDRVPCAPDGTLDPERLADALARPTRLVILSHASNVCGTLLPIKEAGELCAARGVPLALDAAQTAGHIPIDMRALGLSALVVPGHKGLLGPAGIGAALLSPEFAERLAPLATGGTGSRSDSFDMPRELPDKLEAGTGNLPGVCGLSAAVGFILERGVDNFRLKDISLSERFLAGLAAIPGIDCPGPSDPFGRVPVFPVVFRNIDNGEAAARLEREHGIMCRCGLQCAPAAHRTLGIFPEGAVRLSPGWKTTDEEIERTLFAIRNTAGG